MRLSRLLGLVLWVVVAGGEAEDPEASVHIQQYHLQDSQGGYRFGYKTSDQMAEAEGGPKSEVKGRYAYVDENGDMRGVEYTAGVNGYSPKILNKEDAEASILEPTIVKPINTGDKIPVITDPLKNIKYDNKLEALRYIKRGRDIEQMDETEEKTEIEKDAGKTNPKSDVDQSETMNPTGNDEDIKKNIKEETLHGKYTYIEEDGIPATIEYEAGPEIGFVVKSFTKESLQSRLLEKGSDTVYDKDGLTVRKENSPEKFKYIEEGTEEAYPEGFVRGLYTFTDVDGIPATVEYEAGPKIGFVVKKFSKGDVQLDQLGQGTSTSLNTNTFVVPSSVQEDSSEGEPVKYNVYSNEKPHESLSDTYFSLKSRPNEPMNQEHYQVDNSTQVTNLTKNQSFQNDTRIQNDDLEQEELIEQPDGEEEKEIPMSAAYRFGFSVPKQSRHEEADTLGNVHGNYSYVDGAGLLTKVEYEAGAKTGFIIKRMTHEHTKTPPQTSLKGEIRQTQNLALTEKYDKQDSSTKEENIMRKEMHSEKTIVSNQDKELNNQGENVDQTFIDGYEVSPYVLKEYVDERNLPLRSEFNESPDKDSAVSSGSTKHFSFAHPESFHDGSYDLKSPHTNEAVKTHLPKETNTGLISSPYSIFFRDSDDSGIQQETPIITSYEYFHNLPRPVNRQPYKNVFNKEVEPYRAELNPGFSIYGSPLINLPGTIHSFNPDNEKKTVIHKPKYHHKRKKVVKRPLHMTYSRNFTNLQPDGSYSFAYTTKDHSREESIDRNGNVNYSYQIKSKRDGNTLVIFSTQVPHNLVTKNDEFSQEKGEDHFTGSNEYLADPSVDKLYYLHGTTHPSNPGFSKQQHTSRNVNIGRNRKQRVVRRGDSRQPRSNIEFKIPSNKIDTFSTQSVNSTNSSRSDNLSSS